MTMDTLGNVFEGSDILIVDDEPNNLSVLKSILTEQGCRVRPAISGELALRAVQARPPDMILLDVLMPDGMNGFEVCKVLRRENLSQDIPVLFISSLTGTEDKLQGFSVGGQDYIAKPFQAAEVLARVEAHLKLRAMRERLEERNEQLKREIEARKVAQAELAEAYREMEKQANLDGLAQVANRRYFDAALDKEWARARRQNSCFALALCDIDFFKRYNDTYGHQAGDDCLRAVARVIRDAVKRPGDLVARYGGEEFAVILPETDATGAGELGRAIVRAVAEAGIAHAASEAADTVTISLGAAVASWGEDISPAALLAKADAALYQAKNNGRNQACVSAFAERVPEA